MRPPTRPVGAGSHELQAGLYFQLRHDQWDTSYDNNGRQLIDAVLRDPQNPAGGYVPFHEQIFSPAQLTSLHVDSHDAAVYVQGYVATVESADDHARPARRLRQARRSRSSNVTTQQSTEIGPRVGINYQLTSDANIVRVSWGRIYDNLSVNETAAGTNVAGFVDLDDPGLDGSFPVSFVTPPATTRSSNIVIDLDHYHQSHVNELIAGYQRQLPGQTTVELSLLRRDTVDRPATVETNGVYTGHVFVGYADPSQNQIYRLTANTWNWPVLNALQSNWASVQTGCR